MHILLIKEKNPPRAHKKFRIAESQKFLGEYRVKQKILNQASLIILARNECLAGVSAKLERATDSLSRCPFFSATEVKISKLSKSTFSDGKSLLIIFFINGAKNERRLLIFKAMNVWRHVASSMISASNYGILCESN